MLNIPDDQRVEPRYDCPVCIGLPMEKLTLALSERSFTLDSCNGCGGVWFDAGEMTLAVKLGSSKILSQQDKALRFVPRPMACHGCGDLIGRRLFKCPSCDWQNVLACPVCETAMERRSVASFVINTCSTCDGIWLDRPELQSTAWIFKNLEFQRLPTNASGFTSSGLNHTNPSSGLIDPGVQVGLELLSHSPEAGQAIVEVSASLVEVLAAGLEAAPEAAGAILELIGAILGGLLSGL
jgi:Zn-finger nucleic acid-binding protein